jgi:hypothetical protein
MIVAEQVQQTVKRQHADLGALGMAGPTSLTPRDASRNDDVPEEILYRGGHWGHGGKTQIILYRF